MRKRAQSASDISTLILIIGLFLLLYIILVPPETRDELLNLTSSSPASVPASGSKVLLSSSPGNLYPYTSNLQEIKLEPVQLFRRLDAESIPLVRSLIVTHSLLHNGEKTIHFDVDKKSEVGAMKLLALLTLNKGTLSIKLNDALVYEGKLSNTDFPLLLPISSLKDGENSLTFSVSKPSVKFYDTNEYDFKDMRLILNKLEVNLDEERSFYVDEGTNVKAAVLSYYVSCNRNQGGLLKISLNGQNVASNLVFCSGPVERKLYLDNVQSGKNVLRFSLDKGDIILNEPKVAMALGDSVYPSFVFDISEDTYDQINHGAKIKLLFTFSNDVDEKGLDVTVQDEKFRVVTSDDHYEYDITNLVDRGSNVVKLEPINSFDLVNLKVYLED